MKKIYPCTGRRALATLSLVAGAIGLLGLASGNALAQDAYPSKPIRLIVPSAAGTGPDANAREIAVELTKAMGQPVYVENRPGASGIIGTDAAAKAAPDGYTLFMGTNSSMAIVPNLYAKLPFRADRDFIPVSMFGTLHVGLVANPGTGIKDVASLLATVKAKPDSINVATLGPGSFYHLSGEWFGQMTGTKLSYIPYASSSPYSDLIAGQVQVIFDALPVAGGNVRAGKLKLLALTGKNRHPAFPDVPTFAEAGLPDYSPIVWNGLFAPAGTPKPVIDKLYAAMRQGTQDAALRDKWIQYGGELRASASPAEFAEFVAASRAAWAEVVRKSGIKLD